MRLIVFSGVYNNEEASSRLAEAALLKVGDPVELRRNFHSKLDPSAVVVLSKRGVPVGYLAASRAAWIGSKIDKGLVIGATVDWPVGSKDAERMTMVRIDIAKSPKAGKS